MLDLLKKPQTAEPVLFRDGAPRLHARGYLSLPMQSGVSSPCVPLVAAAGFLNHELIFNPRFGDMGIAVLCSAAPHEMLPLDKARESWLVGVQVILSSKKIAADVDAHIAARFAAHPAVRFTTGEQDRFFVFALDREPRISGGIHLPFEPSRSMRWFQTPKNKGTENYEKVKVVCGNDCFAYSGRCGSRSTSGSDRNGPEFHWREGHDLAGLSSADLPTLNAESAAQLRLDIEDLFETAGAVRVL
jgi:hypothetical protein